MRDVLADANRDQYLPPYSPVTYQYLITKDGTDDLPPDLDDGGNVLNHGNMTMGGPTNPPTK